MSNNIHLLAKAKDENLSEMLRDFKKFTSKQIIKAVEQNQRESRKDWMIRVFKKQGRRTAEIKTINSGGRIISRKNAIVQTLVCRN
jgi:hypothetical protein